MHIGTFNCSFSFIGSPFNCDWLLQHQDREVIAPFTSFGFTVFAGFIPVDEQHGGDHQHFGSFSHASFNARASWASRFAAQYTFSMRLSFVLISDTSNP